MAAASKEDYELLVQQARSLLAGESDWVANTANLSALLFNSLNGVNFAGVYRCHKGALLLGPFQGKPACIHLALGKGVCGTAAQKKQSIIVPDVHHFSGHIACDAASKSEIVVPIFKQGQLWGVFDFDSPAYSHFSPLDQFYLSKIAALIFHH